MPIVWRFLDGKAGHERQTAGFVAALQRLSVCEVFNIETGDTNVLGTLFARSLPNKPPRAPDLIIGAGSACQNIMLATKKAFGGKTIYFMRPKYPPSWFDLCVIPRHDNPPKQDNIFLSEGALNDLRPGDAKDPQHGVILVGGPSKHHAWDSERLCEQIRFIVDHSDTIGYTLSGSRRTPSETLNHLSTMGGLNYVDFETQRPNWLLENLSRATNVWVTTDSISMMFEALSSGARLGLLPVPTKRQDRITNISHDLITNRYATHFDSWRDTRTLVASPLLQEADRIAKLVVERFSLNTEV